MVPLALVSILATRWRHLYCHIAWDCPLISSVGIELLSSSARVTSVKSTNPLVCTQLERSGPIDRTPGTPGSDKKQKKGWEFLEYYSTVDGLSCFYCFDWFQFYYLRRGRLDRESSQQLGPFFQKKIVFFSIFSNFFSTFFSTFFQFFFNFVHIFSALSQLFLNFF